MKTGPIFDALVEFFEDDDWKYHILEGLLVLSLPYAGRNGKWTCYAQAREEQDQFVFYSVCPVNATPQTTAAVVEYITRANYGMIIGNFELDYDDGEIRYKTSIDVEGVSLSAALIRQLVYANVLITDRYLPGLMRVIHAEGDPAAEVKRVENTADDPLMDAMTDDEPPYADASNTRTMNGKASEDSPA